VGARSRAISLLVERSRASGFRDRQLARRPPDVYNIFVTRPGGWQDPDETRGAPGAAPGPPAPSAHAWANLAHGRLEPGLTIGGCVVESVLGRGGMGVVLRARAGGPSGPPVAVKVMLEVDRGSSSYERFAREVEAVRTLDHPGIVRVLSAEPRAHVPWLVMELVEGVTLERAFADPKRSLADRLELMEQVCHAVQHAHQRGILHRDLKPANVLVDAQGRAKVTDFGLARNVGRATRLTETGTLIGTPAYLSPESIRGEDTGVAADVWALGVMLYEAVAGCRPFPGGSPLELVRRILDETPLAPSSVNPQATKAHDRVVLRALAKDPSQRHATVNDLAREVHALRSEKKAPRARARRERAGPSSRVLGLGAGALGLSLIVGAVVVNRREEPAPAPPVAAAPPRPPATEAPVEVATEPPPAPPAPPVDHLADHLVEARRALAAFDGEGAEHAAERGLATAPDSVEALFLRGQARDLRLDLVGANADLADVVRRAERTDPGTAYEALLLMAIVFKGQGDERGAAAQLTRAIGVDERRHEAFARRGLHDLYAGAKDGPTCRDDLRRAVRLAPDSAEALRCLGVLAWDDGARPPGDDATLSAGFYDEAEHLLDEALARAPEDAEALGLRSWVHRNRAAAAKRAQDPEAAARHAERQALDAARALTIFERLDDRPGHFVRLARRERARWEQTQAPDAREVAIVAARRAFGENVRHPPALAELGILTFAYGVEQLGQGDGRAEQTLTTALANLDRALAVNAGLREAALYRALLRLEAWSKRDPARALTDLEQVLAARPDHPQALALKAEAERLLGR
jgi:tetratricopeptide (TPR) repeat protein